MKQIWNDEGSGAKVDVSIWRSTAMDGYYCVGDMVVASHFEPRIGFLVRPAKGSMNAVMPSVGYTKIWTDKGSGAKSDVALWSVSCPPAAIFYRQTFQIENPI